MQSYLNEAYLWYPELKRVSVTSTTDVSKYFYSVLTDAPDRFGKPKDRFSFIVPVATADAISTGANVGYGMEWKDDASGAKRVAMVTPNSPAAQAGMARGGALVKITTATNNSWYPNDPNATVTFSYRDTPSSPVREITLKAAPIQDDPVPTTRMLDAGGRKVGYLLFTDHSKLAQDKLIDAVSSMRANGINDLVLDLRYNGGGYLYVAMSMASMIAGPSAEGKVFERLQFNDKRSAETAQSTFPFVTKVLVADSARHPEGEPLPMLSLPRVYVLTTSSSCSASESIINALQGIDVQVVTIGAATCGKPYGFARKDNCGMALYPIEFQGTNAKGFGDYANGLPATCSVADDFSRPLGDPAERMLAAALQHIQTGACPATTGLGTERVRSAPVEVPGPQLADKPSAGRLLMPAY
ncbi:MAG: S41 family peptidase [Pseudomonadota bacterium]|nr:S41 family peptidase [Pseudomonadota bacterium]